ncbi:NO-inducible flavohemoprotein, partial [Vibrio anguillarum]|nr:NO-inducible flavohemoprotein [Vibrio anguillarum]
YQIVGHHLIETLRELAADAFTPDVEAAWTAAYLFLAQVFIDREGELYLQRKQAIGGWENAREFVLQDKVKETEFV